MSKPEPKYETAVEALRVFAGILRDDCHLPINKALRGLRYAYKLPLQRKPPCDHVWTVAKNLEPGRCQKCGVSASP